MVCTMRLKRRLTTSLSSTAKMIGMKNAMPMRGTPLMNRVLRNTRKNSGDAKQPLEELPAGPRAAEQAAGHGELLPGQHDAGHRHAPEHQEQHQRRDQQQVAFLVLEPVVPPRPRAPTGGHCCDLRGCRLSSPQHRRRVWHGTSAAATPSCAAVARKTRRAMYQPRLKSGHSRDGSATAPAGRLTKRFARRQELTATRLAHRRVPYRANRLHPLHPA